MIDSGKQVANPHTLYPDSSNYWCDQRGWLVTHMVGTHCNCGEVLHTAHDVEACADIDQVIEQLAGEGGQGREESERLRKVQATAERMAASVGLDASDFQESAAAAIDAGNESWLRVGDREGVEQLRCAHVRRFNSASRCAHGQVICDKCGHNGFALGDGTADIGKDRHCRKCGDPERLHGPKPDGTKDDGFGGESWYFWHPFEAVAPTYGSARGLIGGLGEIDGPTLMQVEAGMIATTETQLREVLASIWNQGYSAASYGAKSEARREEAIDQVIARLQGEGGK